MATQEQGPSSVGNRERQLVFDEKRNKWRLSRKGIPGNRRGAHISADHAGKMSEGLKQYWKRRREAGQAPIPLHVADKISESMKRYKQRQKEQQQ